LFIALPVVTAAGKSVKFTTDYFQQTLHLFILHRLYEWGYSNKVVELIKYMASVDHAEQSKPLKTANAVKNAASLN